MGLVPIAGSHDPLKGEMRSIFSCLLHPEKKKEKDNGTRKTGFAG